MQILRINTFFAPLYPHPSFQLSFCLGVGNILTPQVIIKLVPLCPPTLVPSYSSTLAPPSLCSDILLPLYSSCPCSLTLHSPTFTPLCTHTAGAPCSHTLAPSCPHTMLPLHLPTLVPSCPHILLPVCPLTLTLF